MKWKSRIQILSVLLVLGWEAQAASDSLEIQHWLQETEFALLSVIESDPEAQVLMDLQEFEQSIHQGVHRSAEEWRQYWTAKLKFEQMQEEEEIKLLGVRFERGIELVRLLYEKILSLDHHFSGMRTYQNVLVLSNPHQYPGFEEAKARLEESLKRKNAIQLPGILHTNPFFSATFSMVTALLGEGEASRKQSEFEQISCILDFTVRMNADLGIIQHETEYLRNANQQLRNACEVLFEDYVKTIGYHVSLEKCRQQDDWERVRMDLDTYLKAIQDHSMHSSERRRELVNLEFATQRVAEFINVYQSSILQGTQYYQKFDRILNSYEHEEICDGQLPMQFEELKYDVKSTIEKFRNTYHLPEIQGSRMKQLLYGHLSL